MAERPTIVMIDIADRDRANAACTQAGLGPEVFAAGLSPTGEEPVTHFWCERDDAGKIRAVLDGADLRYDTLQADNPESAFETRGLKIMPLGPGA